MTAGVPCLDIKKPADIDLDVLPEMTLRTAAMGACEQSHLSTSFPNSGGKIIMKFDRISPVTGEVASSAAAMTAATGPGTRRGLLQKAADALETRRETFAAAMMTETGAAFGCAMFNVELAAA